MVHLRHRNLLQTMAATIFPPFYRHRAARKQYFCHFIVTAQRGNNIFAILSSARGAGTILLPFYRHRAAREQYFCRFIVTARRGNNIFAFYRHHAARERYFCVLSSPCSAGTIFLPFYRHRAARERYFCLSVLLKYIPERFWLLQANCERSEMWREPRGDGGGPRAEGKMKSSHSK